MMQIGTSGTSIAEPTLKSNSSEQNGNANSQWWDVYDGNMEEVYSIPASQIYHAPSTNYNQKLILCRNYVVGDKESCSMGQGCKFVHADTTGCTKHPIHVNYAWKTPDVCKYARLQEGTLLEVLAPNNREPRELIDSGRVLATRGALNREQHKGQLSHCAHYHFNRLCNRGEKCNFIHAVHVDPDAKPGQRAPPPTASNPGATGSKRLARSARRDQQQQQTQAMPSTPSDVATPMPMMMDQQMNANTMPMAPAGMMPMPMMQPSAMQPAMVPMMMPMAMPGAAAPFMAMPAPMQFMPMAMAPMMAPMAPQQQPQQSQQQ